MINNKHVSSGTVTAAGNDISRSLKVTHIPTSGSNHHLRLRQISVMFHCKNNKTERQNKPAHEAETFVIDDLCVSQKAQRR